MKSKTKIYHGNADQCEARAQDMPPTLRREFLALAENWRKLAFKGRYEAKADPPKKVGNDKIVESATLARHQINVTHLTGIMHLSMTPALCNSSRRSGSRISAP